ncbi:uncharacterized protein AKAME5_002855200 [Lates japonicus]|uniref:Uncharacterized protein n=1 Tax=Lates japonicus TaxID=270547 RepID=A0AAD3ML68_LATJO|nr:uncharacterized protein AKAME5_002855200 [Lates japonicus]
MRGASRGAPAALVTLDNLEPIAGPRGGDVSFECLPYQLSMVLSVPTMVTTGNGESGFDSGEGAEKRLPHPRKAAGAQITHSRLGELDLGIELTVRREASYRLSQPLPLGAPSMLLAECPAGSEAFTLKKLECSKQARSPEYRS